jgi:hypothetical protein
MREVYKNEDDINHVKIAREIRNGKELIKEMTNS